MNRHLRALAAVLSLAVVGACGEPAPVDSDQGRYPTLPQAIDEAAPIDVPETEPEMYPAWPTIGHVGTSTYAAQKWGLAASRVSIIGAAADDPDTYESGFDNAYNQQWSHAYIYSIFGFWIWGDANENFDDCLTGNLAGQLEGPECKDGKSAKYFYVAGDQRTGDTYMGYASHYVEDVSLILHSSSPSTEMLTKHNTFETWVANNWTAGHNFAATVAADGYYYAITDLQQAVRNAAWGSCYYNSSGPGRAAWDAYKASGFPTAAGSGNANAVYYTKQMLIRASRYATGAIKWTLDTYGQWTAEY